MLETAAVFAIKNTQACANERGNGTRVVLLLLLRFLFLFSSSSPPPTHPTTPPPPPPVPFFLIPLAPKVAAAQKGTIFGANDADLHPTTREEPTTL